MMKAERGDHSMNLMRLKSQFDAESAKLRASLNDKDEEHERVVAVLHEKMEKLRRANKELENTQEEASVAKIRERIDRAVQHALSDQRHEQEAKIEALNQSWEMRINSIEESWQRKMSDSDKIHQVTLNSICRQTFVDLLCSVIFINRVVYWLACRSVWSCRGSITRR